MTKVDMASFINMDGSPARGCNLDSLGQMSRLLEALGDYFQITLIFKLLSIGPARSGRR
ncbi:MAG: hypothetical protein ACRC62_17945 [Microcoleus sp.]